MALDKQKILNDLGNVMNQLQSADCGCMGKLFSNPGHGQGVGGQPCGNQCWRNQSYGHPCAGEPNSMNQQAPGMHGRPCMGHCNPPKLYADTYSYLNQNLMQPVVKEVYEDLRGICPANAVMNDPLGAQMGLAQNSPKSPMLRGNMDQVLGQSPMGDGIGGQNAMPGGMPGGNSMAMGGEQQQNPMGGMGAEIVNMMMKSNKSQPMNMAGQGGQPAQGGAMNAHMGANQGLYSGNMGGMGGNQSQVGGMDPNAVQYNANNMEANQGQFNTANIPHLPADQYSTGNMGANQNQYYTGMANMGHGNAVSGNQNPTPQYMNQQNAYTVGSAQGNAMPNMAGNMNQNPQMGNMQGGQRQQMPAQSGNYGQHSQGIAKFKEMFPGVMQGLGGELDFDPMAIAIQMNPANKQQATMDTMQKLMSGKSGTNKQLDANAAAMKPVMNGMNAVAANFNQNQQQPAQETQNQQQYNTGMANQPNQMQQQVVNTAITDSRMNQQIPQQQVLQQQVPQQQVPQQQVPLQQVPQQQVPQQQVPQQQMAQGQDLRYQVMDQNYQDQLQSQPRNPGTVNLPSGGYPNQIPSAPQQIIKEPIYPVDTSKSYQYNTLGQPIETYPANTFHTKEPGLPQTLSPEPIPPQQQRYSNVKSTISKTSLFGNRTTGRTPSRAQLQQVYNQYKGSHSYTNQNIQNIRTPAQHGRQQLTASDGHLNINQPNLPRLHVPVEKVGGDTIANNQVPIAQMVDVKGDNNIGQLGDVAANKPQGDADMAASPMKNGKLRNGLQDIVYTSYPQSAAWSFHGHPNTLPYSYRNRV